MEPEKKSNIKFHSNLYILKEDFRINDTEFVSKIVDSKLLKKYKNQGVKLSEAQENIVSQSAICEKSKYEKRYKDPCWGLKNGKYICRCVEKECEDITVCRKENILTNEEYNQFKPKDNNIYCEYDGYKLNIPKYSKEYGFDENENFSFYNYKVIRKDSRVAMKHNVFKDVDYYNVKKVIHTSSQLDELNEFEENNLDELNENDKNLIKEEIEQYDDWIEETFFDDELLDEDQSIFSQFKVVSQEHIINEDKNKSFIINAGPGTGKTYTLIQKIYNLVVKQNLDAEKILILSFTNAAVNEIRERLNNFVKKEHEYALNRVEIRTFDSFIGNILYQIVEDYKYSYGDYDISRRDMINILKNIENNEWIKDNIEYLFIDEIQDSTDEIARFIIELIKNCEFYKVSYSLLGDSCQSINDYEQKNRTRRMYSKDFYSELFKICSSDVQKVQIVGNHRQSDALLEITENYRKLLLAQDNNLSNYIKDVFCNEKDFGEDIESNSDLSIAFLTRKKIEALKIAAYLYKEFGNVNYITDRIDVDLSDWVSKVFFEKEFKNYSYEDFENRVIEKNIELPQNYVPLDGQDYSIRAFWDYLLFLTKSKNGYLDNQELLDKLYNHELDNPIFKFKNESQVIVTNIHKAKGREYTQVILPESYIKSVTDNEVEQKIFYVAITRPKQMICVSKEMNPTNVYNYSKLSRPHKRVTGKLTHLEVKYEDIDIDSLNQDYLINIGNSMLNDEICLYKYEDDHNNAIYSIVHYNYKDNRKYTIGEMTERFTDIVKIYSKGRMPDEINELFITGNYSKIFEKDEEFTIKNVISFAGLGHMIYYTY